MKPYLYGNDVENQPHYSNSRPKHVKAGKLVNKDQTASVQTKGAPNELPQLQE
jgi:hypothetical protein